MTPSAISTLVLIGIVAVVSPVLAELTGRLAVPGVVFELGLVLLAFELGLDVLLGAFAAGIVVRLLVRGEDTAVVRGKLEAIGFGFLVPIFFVVSGMQLDLHALFATPTALLRVPLFLALLLVVRGTPALLLYRRDLPRRELVPSTRRLWSRPACCRSCCTRRWRGSASGSAVLQ